MDVLPDGAFVAYEEVTGNKDGITKIKSTSRFIDDQFRVVTQYFKQVKWADPESRSYQRNSKKVKFK